ncbi:hypothetical protein ACFW9F_11880 [Streptomyces sp. NPDC059506]|uniref:hypothetical protein n=1 Tax=Streptomyces TaxID=1883 RepID=UPI000CC3C5B4|nr:MULTISPECIES: hypothetical protein [unclassified Streptomyces]MCZ2524586.1 hypothetical protein [Streptomyces sp. HB2AG]PLW73967.1 hypothetical protein C0036_04430 [Streptomyces sp. DJ]QMV22643.1 hypothetical protein GQS52_13625 [Streptomyces sp. SCUT-3]
MESGPAAFAGVVLVVFGTVLLGWSGVRAGLGAPVVQGAGPAAAAGYALVGAVAAAAGVWCLLHV